MLFTYCGFSKIDILDIVSTIQENMGKRLFSCGVFIDLKKAFDIFCTS